MEEALSIWIPFKVRLKYTYVMDLPCVCTFAPQFKHYNGFWVREGWRVSNCESMLEGRIDLKTYYWKDLYEWGDHHRTTTLETWFCISTWTIIVFLGPKKVNCSILFSPTYPRVSHYVEILRPKCSDRNESQVNSESVSQTQPCWWQNSILFSSIYRNLSWRINIVLFNNLLISLTLVKWLYKMSQFK